MAVMITDYEARTLQNESCFHVRHISNTKSCPTLAWHMSYTLEPCRISRNWKIAIREPRLSEILKITCQTPKSHMSKTY